jgi:hypothetical protein
MTERSRQNGGRPADIVFWFKDGHLAPYRARVAANTEVSIGRTDSKRALGFIVTNGKNKVDFVLDRDQVAELAAFLQQCALPRLLKPLGPKRSQTSLAALNSPKRRLHMALEKAATSAHPGWKPLRRGQFVPMYAQYQMAPQLTETPGSAIVPTA